MNNLLRLFLIGSLISLGLFSCGKDKGPENSQGKVEEDGSINNNMPGGGKYVSVELVSAEPDWSNIKVGETVTLKFKVMIHLDESKEQYSKMFVDQKADKGSSMENMNPEISVGPVSASNIEGTILGGTSSIVSDKATNEPIYMKVTIKPNYALPTTVKIVVAILSGADDVKHAGKTFTYKFTSKN